MDEDRLRAERANRHSWKSRVTGLEDMGEGFGSDATTPKRQRQPRPRRDDEDDLEYRLAIEASKNEAEEDAKRRAQKAGREDDDDDLAKAIKLSKEEEELRRRELEQQNADSLFDDTPAQAAQPTGFNQGYQQGAAVDWFANPMDQQQPQSTGFLNNAYSQSTGMQPQQTGFQTGYGYQGYQQPQQTGFDQAFQQQPQQQYMQTQQTSYNPWGSQMNGFDPMQQQQQPLQQQPTAQAGSNNPWASATQQQNSLAPQPTGSNNPFASSFNRPQQTAARAPTLSALQEQKTATQFTQPSYNPITSYQAAQQPITQQQTAQPQQALDPHREQLNALLASGEGQDTFGNVGNLRIPAQHTAPGTFVNSAGAGTNRLVAERTGHNPFLHSQFTGVPQQFPAQTGPAGGFGSSNPFGQQRQQGGQSGSLIDL